MGEGVRVKENKGWSSGNWKKQGNKCFPLSAGGGVAMLTPWFQPIETNFGFETSQPMGEKICVAI